MLKREGEKWPSNIPRRGRGEFDVTVLVFDLVLAKTDGHT